MSPERRPEEAWGGLLQHGVGFKMMRVCVYYVYIYSLRRQIHPMKHKFNKDKKVPVCLSHVWSTI